MNGFRSVTIYRYRRRGLDISAAKAGARIRSRAIAIYLGPLHPFAMS